MVQLCQARPPCGRGSRIQRGRADHGAGPGLYTVRLWLLDSPGAGRPASRGACVGHGSCRRLPAVARDARTRVTAVLRGRRLRVAGTIARTGRVRVSWRSKSAGDARLQRVAGGVDPRPQDRADVHADRPRETRHDPHRGQVGRPASSRRRAPAAGRERAASRPPAAPASLRNHAGQARNLEIKAIDADPPATLQAALEFGAEDQGWLHQRDTYFHAVQGRLKLREAPPAGRAHRLRARGARRGRRSASTASSGRRPSRADRRADRLARRARRRREGPPASALAQRAHPPRSRRGTRRLRRARGGRGVAGRPRGRARPRGELRAVLGIADEQLIAHGYADLVARRGGARTVRLA